MGLPVVSWQDSWVSELSGSPHFPWVPSFSHRRLVLVAAIANQKCINLTNLRSTARHRNAARLIFPVPLLVCKTAKIHMPHSRFQRTRINGHMYQEMQHPIPAPRQAMVCVGFLTWSINWTVSEGEITRIGWQRKAMTRTTCSLIQLFVAKNGKICTQFEIFVTIRIVPCLSIYHTQFTIISKNEGILIAVQAVLILRVLWVPRPKMKLGSPTLIHWQITTFRISLIIIV